MKMKRKSELQAMSDNSFSDRSMVKKQLTHIFSYEDEKLIKEGVVKEEFLLDSSHPPLQKEGSNDSDRTPKAENPLFTKPWERSSVMSMEFDDDKVKAMTGSYSEILDWHSQREGINVLEEEDLKSRNAINMEGACESGKAAESDLATPVYDGMDPEQAFLAQERLSAFMTFQENSTDYSANSYHQDRPAVLYADTSFGISCLSQTGQLMREGELLSYVADDIQRKIKLSSPASKAPSLLRSALQLQVPPIDPAIISDLEAHARHVATALDNLTESLTETLHCISGLTVECVETYRDAVCKTCDAVDGNIKSMYQLMAKCEELSKAMKPVYKLHGEVKEIRRLLDLFESVIQGGGT